MKKTIKIAMMMSALLTLVVCKPAFACPIKSTLGAIIGAPVGMVSGLLRGASAKGIEYPDTFSKEIGHGTLGKVIGYPAGLVTGIVGGGLGGIVTGAVHGISKGIDDPFSTASMSLDGKFTDFDPYAVFQ